MQSLSIDEGYIVRLLTRLAKVRTDVPLGFDTLIEPDDPKLVHYVQEVLRPELIDLGYYDLIDAPSNNLVVRTGAGSRGPSLIVLNYTPAQHHNLMDDPFSGRIASPLEIGLHQPAVFGQGVSQAKVHQVAMLAVLKALSDSDADLSGCLYWAINNEGRSSHECTNAILDVLPEAPAFGVIQIPTGFQISLGNRGRIDVDVELEGRVAHSSTPEKGLSAIDGAAEVVQRLKALRWGDEHELLGGRHAVVYKIRYDPVAPHTLPSHAQLTVDRRLLPGDSLEGAVHEVEDAIGDMAPYHVSVRPGVHMLPALVEPDHPGVAALRQAHTAVSGGVPTETYFTGTFDAGGLCARGIPTVMYGAGGGIWPVGPDFVTIQDAVVEARTLWHMVTSYLS